MGRKLNFKPGSFYRTSDRSGFPVRAERTRKEWTGLIVEDKLWEARQPQDLVRGVVDDQSVPDARPLGPNVFVGPVYGQLSGSVAVDGVTIPLQSTAGMAAGDLVAVMLDNGALFESTAYAVRGSAVVLNEGVPYTASSGNAFIDYRVPGPFLDKILRCVSGQFPVTTTGQHIRLVA